MSIWPSICVMHHDAIAGPDKTVGHADHAARAIHAGAGHETNLAGGIDYVTPSLWVEHRHRALEVQIRCASVDDDLLSIHDEPRLNIYDDISQTDVDV